MSSESEDLTDKLGIDHSHELRESLIVGLLSIILSLYAAWILADLIPRWFVFIVVMAIGVYLLYSQKTLRGIISNALYLLAGLFVLTPVGFFLPPLANADKIPGGHRLLIDIVTLALFIIFIVLALIVGGVGYWISRNEE